MRLVQTNFYHPVKLITARKNNLKKILSNTGHLDENKLCKAQYFLLS